MNDAIGIFLIVATGLLFVFCAIMAGINAAEMIVEYVNDGVCQ